MLGWYDSRIRRKKGRYDFDMKRLHKRLLVLCLFVILGLCPLQADAAERIPAGGITTLAGDSRYIDAGWFSQPLIFTFNGQTWAMGLDAIRDYPVFLSENGGIRQCTLGDAAAFTDFINAVNDQLKAQTFDGEASLFDTGTGSYVRSFGKAYYQLSANVTVWVINTVQQQLAAGNPQPLVLDLTEEYLTCVVENGKLSCSPDFVLASSYSTSFSGSSSNRITNIQVAAGHLNNMVVMPGQEVSISEAIRPRTAANGYKPAGTYVNGRTVQSTGGGICQVSSTVYVAVKNAGLQILERHPHSMPVHYLPLGMDAAITAGSKDMRFKNNYSAPVILQAYTKGNQLIINCLVWEQDLGGRSYKLWSKETGSLSAKTYFTTYQDGQEVSTDFIGTSRYSAPKPQNSGAEDE